MSLWDEAVEILHNLGLTSCMAKVYITLLNYGASNAKSISTLSGVTRQDVYRIIPKLQQKGLVLVELTNPTLFKATCFREGVAILMNERRKKNAELNRQIKYLKKNLEKIKQKDSVDEPKFILVPTKAAFFKRKKLLSGAKSSVDVLASKKFFLMHYILLTK